MKILLGNTLLYFDMLSHNLLRRILHPPPPPLLSGGGKEGSASPESPSAGWAAPGQSQFKIKPLLFIWGGYHTSTHKVSTVALTICLDQGEICSIKWSTSNININTYLRSDLNTHEFASENFKFPLYSNSSTQAL